MLLTTWQIIKLIIWGIIIINEIAALYTVFREKRDIAATWAWLLVLTLIPVLGFILYAFLGRKLPQDKMERIQSQTELELSAALEEQKKQFLDMPRPKKQTMRMYRRTIMLFQSIDNAFLTRHNQVDIYTDGQRLFQKMFDDLSNAQKSIHIEFYTIYNDRIGNQLRTLLEQKAAEGVEVRVLYDSWGSMGVKRSFYDALRQNGGLAEPFLMTHSNLFDFRLNYRDHRKIVTIDGKIGYVGGFNVGDQYLGRLPKFGYWRDTHLRVIGGGVYSLQQRFIRDWNASQRHVQDKIIHYRPYFPPITVKQGNTALQIVSNGPESPLEKIKLGYLRLINAAQDHIWIQTPYLIPDDSVLDALRIAIHSGVDVRIMIPCKPDHPFIYWASYSYMEELIAAGVKCYVYNNGFLHAKGMMVDGLVSCYGTANMDIRSFHLNFEVNATLYSKEVTGKLEEAFKKDLEVCTRITPMIYAKRSLIIRMKEQISRMLSPLL